MGARIFNNFPTVDNNDPMTIVDSVLTGNAAGSSSSGGAMYNEYVLTISGSTLSDNSAGGGGGIYSLNGFLKVTNSVLSQNLAQLEGGGIFSLGDFEMTVTNTAFINNSATYGGGLAGFGTVTGCTFSGNVATYGGAVYQAGSISGSTFIGNLATEQGGAIFSQGGTVNGSNFASNSAPLGGGIYADSGPLDVSGSTLSGNSATFGGGIYNSGLYITEITLSNTQLSDNSATVSGGGIFNDPLGVLKDCERQCSSRQPGSSRRGRRKRGYVRNPAQRSRHSDDLNPASTIIDIEPSDTATALIASVDAGGQIVFTARVLSADSGAGPPAGTVTLYDANNNALATQTLVGGEAVFSGPALVTSSTPLHAVYSGGGSFDFSTSAYLIQSVNALTPSNLQAVVDSLPTGNATAVALQATNETTWQAALAAINDVTSPIPATVVLNVGSGPFSGVTYDNADPDVSFVLNGSEIDGGTIVNGNSPALLVLAGKVTVMNVTFTTPTDDPTVLVAGGSLTLRNCAVEESTGFDDAAVTVTGGSLDLGTEESPGGNTINVNGAGEQLLNLGTEPVSTVGTIFLWMAGPLRR